MLPRKEHFPICLPQAQDSTNLPRQNLFIHLCWNLLSHRFKGPGKQRYVNSYCIQILPLVFDLQSNKWWFLWTFFVNHVLELVGHKSWSLKLLWLTNIGVCIPSYPQEKVHIYLFMSIKWKLNGEVTVDSVHLSMCSVFMSYWSLNACLSFNALRT
jgi:hypothetical protein